MDDHWTPKEKINTIIFYCFIIIYKFQGPSVCHLSVKNNKEALVATVTKPTYVYKIET